MGGFPFGPIPKVLLATASSLYGRKAPVVRREAPVLLPAVGGFPFGQRPNVLPVVRREAPVLLPAEGGFPFGRSPKVLLAVGELFVRARSPPKCYCPPKSGFHSADGRRFCSPALC